MISDAKDPLRTHQGDHLLPGRHWQAILSLPRGQETLPLYAPPPPHLPGGKPCCLTTKEAATIFKRPFPGAEGNTLLNRGHRSGGRHLLWLFSFLYLFFHVPNQAPHSLLPQPQRLPTRTSMPCQQGETRGLGHREKARARQGPGVRASTRGRCGIKSESGSGGATQAKTSDAMGAEYHKSMLYVKPF